MPIPLDEQQAGRCLQAVGFTFLFAPHYHPAMKGIGPVRAALGVRTIFNILGPLANPAAPPFHVIGAFNEPMAQLMAETLLGMDIERAFVLHGAPGWDEPTPVGPFVCFDVRGGRSIRMVRDPADYGISRCPPHDLFGGDAGHNAGRLAAALRGGDTQAHRDALTLGAALALEVTGAASDFRQALDRAREALAGGAGESTLTAMRVFAQTPA
jgi:anthranilate phosphoribosyltransferase